MEQDKNPTIFTSFILKLIFVLLVTGPMIFFYSFAAAISTYFGGEQLFSPELFLLRVLLIIFLAELLYLKVTSHFHIILKAPWWITISVLIITSPLVLIAVLGLVVSFFKFLNSFSF